MMDDLLLTLTMPDWSAILIHLVSVCTHKAVLKTVDYLFQRFRWPHLETERTFRRFQLFTLNQYFPHVLPLPPKGPALKHPSSGQNPKNPPENAQASRHYSRHKNPRLV